MIGLGLEHKTIEDLEKDLSLPPNQLLALFNKIIKKTITLLEDISVKEMNKLMFKDKSELAVGNETINKMQPLAQSLEEELNEVAREVKTKEMDQKKQLLDVNMKQYEIKGTEHEW